MSWSAAPRDPRTVIRGGNLMSMQEEIQGCRGPDPAIHFSSPQNSNQVFAEYERFKPESKYPAARDYCRLFDGNDTDNVGWPRCGEIDIMENVGKEPVTIHGTI